MKNAIAQFDIMNAEHVLEDLGGTTPFLAELRDGTDAGIDLAWRAMTCWAALDRADLSVPARAQLETLVAEHRALFVERASEYPDPLAWIECARELDERVVECGQRDSEGLDELYHGLDQAVLFMDACAQLDIAVPSELHDHLLAALDFARDAYGLFDSIRHVVRARAEMIAEPQQSRWPGSFRLHAELLEQFQELSAYDA